MHTGLNLLLLKQDFSHCIVLEHERKIIFKYQIYSQHFVRRSFYQQWPLSFSDTDSNKTHLSHSMSCYRSVPNPPYTIDCCLDNTNYSVQTWDSKFDLALLCFFFFPDPGASTDITKIYRTHMLGKWKVCQFSLRLNALNTSGQIVSAWIFAFLTTYITL